MITVMGIFSGRHFPREVILWAVRRSLPLRRQLSGPRGDDDLSRGVPVDHTPKEQFSNYKSARKHHVH